MKFETTGAAVVLMAVICAVSIVAVASPSDGDSLVLDGIVYGTNPDGTLSVIGCDPQTIPEDVAIPAEVDGVPVTHIDGRAFSGSSVRSIGIPATVTSLYEQTTFLECPTLERIDVDPANETYRSVDGVLFQGSTLLVIPASYPVTDYIVPDGTETLGLYMLSENTTVESIVVPSTVTSIDPLSFIDGFALEDIAVDPDNPVYSSVDGVIYTDGGTKLFAFPSGRTGGYTVPDGVTAIGDFAFFGSSLTSVIISDSVTSVGMRVLQQCQNLESVSIGASVADIGLAFMNGCPSATSMTVSRDNPHFWSDGYGLYSADGDFVKLADGYEGAYVIHEGTEVLRSYSISYNDGITSVTMPASVTTLESAAVFYCPGITELVFEGAPRSFGALSLALSDDESSATCDVYIGVEIDLTPYSNAGTTFVYHYLGYIDGVHYSVLEGEAVADGILSTVEEVTVLDSVTIDGVGYEVTTIGFGASHNDTLRYLSIPADVLVGPGGLSGFTALESIRVYGEGDLRSEGGVLFDADLTTLIQYPAGIGLNHYEVPDTVDTIQDGAFLNAQGLYYLSVPASVTCLGTGALSGLTLETLRIPGSFLESDESFSDTGVSEIVIIDGQTCLDLSILDEFYSFGSVSFPSSLSELRGSTEMTFIIVDDGALRPLDEATAQDLAGRMFDCSSGELIQTDATATADGIVYRVTSFDSRTAVAYGYVDGIRDIIIADSVEILGGEYRVTSVADGAFANFQGDGELTIPEGVTRVGKEAFLHAGITGTVHIPASLTRIGEDAFGEMVNVTAFDVADGNPVYTDMEGLLCLGDSVIVQCPSGMTGILRIECDILSLDGFAWSRLTGVEIDGFVTIAERAFEHSDIQYVTVTGEVTNIGAMAFQGSYIESLHASEILRISEGAFSNCYYLEHVSIPDSVAYIAPDAFDRISGDLVFMNIWGQELEVSAESLRGHSYNLMTGSDDVLLESAEYLDGMRFSDGTLLYSATGPSEAEVAGKLSGTTLDVPESFAFGGTGYRITGIGDFAFYRSDLTALGGLGSVTTVGEHAFEWSALGGGLTIPDSVTSIGAYAFAHCDGITSLDLGSVEFIESYAFASMGGIDEIPLEIPATLQNMSALAFDKTCFSEYVVEDGNRFYTSVDGVLYYYDSLYGVPYAYSFDGEGSGPITIPENCTGMFYGALDCPFITAVYVEEGNTHFTSVDGVLYSKDMSTLCCRPGEYGKDLVIPEGVVCVYGDALVGPSVTSEHQSWHVSFPESLEELMTGFPYLVMTQDGAVEATAELLAGNSFLVYDGMLLPQVYVSVESTSGGAVTGEGFYYPGEVVTVTVTPDSGYRISSILVNGERQKSAEFQIVPEEDVVVVVTFARIGGGSGTVTPEPDEDEEVVENPDGSTTTTVTRPDGSSTSTTERPDGSSTVIDERPVPGGTQTTVTDADAEGNTTTTITTVTENTTSGGSRVTSTTVEETDSEGNTTSKTESTYISGDGSTVTQIAVSVDADGNTAASSVSTISLTTENGTATVTYGSITALLDQMADAGALADGMDRTVIISTGPDTSASVSVVFDTDAMKAIAGSGAEMVVSGEVGSISVPSEVTDSLANQSSEISIGIGVADKTQMTPAQQEAVGDRPALILTAADDSDIIHDLGGYVTVSVPYTPGDGTDTGTIRVCYVDDDGTMQEMGTSYSDGKVTFLTDHFSYFVIVSDSAEPSPAGDGTSQTLLLAAAIIVAVLVIAAVAYAAKSRKT